MRVFWTVLAAALTVATASMLASCSRQPCDGGGGNGLSARLDVSLGTCNAAPIARIDVTSMGTKKNIVILDASASDDPNDDPLSYSWNLRVKPDGSSVALTDTKSKNSAFTPEKGGNYVVELIVNDGELNSDPEVVSVFVRNNKPVAVAGEDFAQDVGTMAALDGTRSSDGDGEPLSYTWSIDQAPAGSLARLDNPSSPQPHFMVDVAGVYAVSLRVNDGEEDSVPDVVRVGGGVTGTRPIAIPRSNLTGLLGQTVHLDGTASMDPDGAPLTYDWRMASEPMDAMAVLDRATTATPSFVPLEVGTYQAELIVNDGFFDSAPAIAVIDVVYGTGVPGSLCEPDGCKERTTCFEGTCVGTGALRFSLSWTVVSDFDLHVKTPSGVEIFFGNSMGMGGELDVDDCVGNSCRSAMHVENIVFEDDPMPGTYEVWVVNFNGGGSGSFQIQVTGAARGMFTGTLPASANTSSMHNRVTVR